MIKLLYIEDNDDNIYMLKMRLELLDEFEVLTAEDGEKGCEMAAAERPDIVLMDLEMPGIDGWEATRRLMRSPAPAKRRSPPAATSSTPSRSNSIGWSRRCGASSPAGRDLLRALRP